jgi:hypothetical protein
MYIIVSISIRAIGDKCDWRVSNLYKRTRANTHIITVLSIIYVYVINVIMNVIKSFCSAEQLYDRVGFYNYAVLFYL